MLLDSHALVWWLAEDARLPAALQASITRAPDIVVSAASVWEIEIKRRSGKLDSPPDLLEQLRAAQFALLPIEARDAHAAAALPRLHGDPFDRMLVAQAKRFALPLATKDGALAAYGIETRWA
jgi:PIN domain nuclease of toxin-antitoxin system